ncbi:hypothetical protein E1B28_007950 [Marasmius oreades]|uniref:Uncharacterized protein n=1 Tax=Marasmius oreades TaxID=181124 RepID=A0A9P7S306_9AGAR|nr:uncharacterized protein E1B28_007950 [Marasmius oreades]KAG7094350.1 hypothetical protein E1B28_007950 [Marasmius oreades]
MPYRSMRSNGNPHHQNHQCQDSRRQHHRDDRDEQPRRNSTRNDRSAQQNPKKRKGGPASIVELLHHHKSAKTKGLVVKKLGNRLDDYKDTARWIASSFDPNLGWIQILYTGIIESFELGNDSELSMGLPTDDSVKADCLEAFNILKKKIGEDILLRDMDRLLEDGMVDELAKLLDRSSSDERTQDTRDLKENALHYLQLALGIDSFNPPINPHATKSLTRGLNHPQIARVVIPAAMVAEFDADQKQFLEKVENGEIQYNEDDFGLCMYQDGIFDPTDIESGLFQSLFLVLCWKCIFLGKQAAANHGKKNMKGKGGTAAKHDLGRVTKRTIAYAVVQALHAIGSSNDWRVDDQGIPKTDVWDSVLDTFNGDPEFEEQCLKWWNTVGISGISLNSKQNKTERIKKSRIHPNSMREKMELQWQQKRLEREAAATDPAATATRVNVPSSCTVHPTPSNDTDPSQAANIEYPEERHIYETQIVAAGTQFRKTEVSRADAATDQEGSTTEPDSDEDPVIQKKRKSRSYRKKATVEVIEDGEEEASDNDNQPLLPPRLTGSRHHHQK